MSVNSTIYLGLKNAAVKTGLDKTKRDVEKFGSSVKNALAGVALGGGVLASLKMASEKYDAMGKAADRLGVSVELLQKLGAAADLAGLAPEKATQALQTFAKNVGDANAGVGRAQAVLAELNLTLADSDGKVRSVDALFEEAANKIAKIPEAADRVRMAMRLFGSEGAGILDTIKDGFNGIEEAAAGITLLDRAQMADIEAFNDSVTRLKTNLMGVAGMSLAKLTEQMGKITRGIEERLGREERGPGDASAVALAQRGVAEARTAQDAQEAIAAQMMRVRAQMEEAQAMPEAGWLARNSGILRMFGDPVKARAEAKEAAIARLKGEMEGLESLRDSMGKGSLFSGGTRKELEAQQVAAAEAARQMKEREAAQMAGAGSPVAGLSLMMGMLPGMQMAAEVAKDTRDLEMELAAARADADAGRMEAETRILEIRKRQAELRDGFGNLADTEARKAAAEEILALEKEGAAVADALAQKRAEAAERVREAGEALSKKSFLGGVDELRNIGGTLGRTVLRLEAPKKASEELRVAKDMLKRLDEIFEKIPEEIALPGAEIAGTDL